MAWKSRTNVGRVVYTRKPHFFNCKDISRVIRGINEPADGLSRDFECYFDTLIRLYALVEAGATYGGFEEDVLEFLGDRFERQSISYHNRYDKSIRRKW